MAEHIAERPQVLSYLLFAGALLLADRALRGSNGATVGLATLIVCWANVHLAFSLGVALVVLIAVGRAIHDRRWRRPMVVAVAAGLAGLCTPHGIGGYTAALAVRNTSSVIQEWRHIDLTRPHDLGVVLLILLTLVAMARTGRWRRLDCVLPVCALIALTVDSMRQEAFLALVIAPELALGLSSFPVKTLRGRNLMRARALWHGAVVGLVIVIAVSLVEVTRFRGTPATFYPVDATAAIPDGCRLLNEYVFGGYITDERWPDVLVSQDGRNPLEQDFERQEEVLDGRAGAMEWIDDNGVDCALVRPDRPIVGQLRTRGWRRVATDPSAVLLVRP